MANPAFATGTQVEWRGHVGEIRFVDDIYLTICLLVNPEDRARDVCLVDVESGQILTQAQLRRYNSCEWIVIEK